MDGEENMYLSQCRDGDFEDNQSSSKCIENGEFDDDCRAGIRSASCAFGYILEWVEPEECDVFGCDYECTIFNDFGTKLYN